MKKPLFFCMAILLFMFMIMFLFIAGNSKDEMPLYPLYQLEGAGNTVFITFNILWDVEEELEALLDYLYEKEIEAVFFATGDWVKKFPELAARILERGQHLGNYALSYRRLILMTEEEVKAEIKEFNELCLGFSDLGYKPLFFRPAHGEYSSKIVRLAKEAGCLTLLWSINARTLTQCEPAFILNHLEERLHPGAVILFHLSPGMASAFPQIVDFLIWKGYALGSPKQLLK